MKATHTSIGLRSRWLTAALAVSVLAACASTPPPRERLMLAQASVEAAASAGAPQFAPAEFERARTKLEAAKVAMARSEFGKAHVMAEQADADALVARHKAGAERARQATEEVNAGLKALREQSMRR
ncbi:DUF4398 domain-containing protein [Aquabacterium fontiphilum]|uniref:DUF4398 domain-containing protein n=1 Tax=Aquabacterium fontiphilum TaxID=450365 RepID=UPI001378F28B|nr:DUF4398 domain-containing protein [Aquabacterium fontiphilum]NBD22118.1 DUF4398 domain-containing protein [Aquabacterium fontiphilum]